MTFGKMPIANNFLTKDEMHQEYFFDMSPAFCNQCKTFQLTEQPDPKKMFHSQYPFFTRSSKVMSQHFRSLAKEIEDQYCKNPDFSICELGCNDGAFLEHFANKNMHHLGIEPSENVAQEANKHGVKTSCVFFNDETAENIKQQNGQFDVIYSANVMCHIADLNSVARGVCALLKPDGHLIFEDPYLGNVFEKTSYDQIYGAHIYLFSLHSVKNIFEKHGLKLVDVTPLETHGGSMRYTFAKDTAEPCSPAIEKWLSHEKKLALDQTSFCKTFKQNCKESKAALVNKLKKAKAEGKKVVGYAATAKSTTVLNYCGIGTELIDCIYDTTPLKQGKFTPGTYIPILPYSEFSSCGADVCCLFAWNHKNEIFDKEKDFTENGGQWISHVAL